MLAVGILLLITHLMALVVLVVIAGHLGHIAGHLGNVAGAIGHIARAWSLPQEMSEADEEGRG